MEKYIPLSIPNFEGNEKKYVDDALQLGWVSTGGAYITKLEEMMAEYLHIPQVVACQSGTSALHLALLGCGVEPGDMVIVPTLTFIAAVIRSDISLQSRYLWIVMTVYVWIHRNCGSFAKKSV